MTSATGSRVRRLVITAFLAAGLGAGAAGVAMAATSGGAASGASVTALHLSSSPKAGSGSAGMPGTGTHHCTHMSGSSHVSSR